MGDRDPRECGRRDRGADARDDLVRDTRGLERERLFAAAAEHERIAALEANDAVAALRRTDQQRVDAVLIDRRTPGALADEEPLRLRRELEQVLLDERVVEDEVRFAQPAQRLQ